MELKLLRAPAEITGRDGKVAATRAARSRKSRSKGGVPLPWLRRERRRYQPLIGCGVCTTRCEFDAIRLRRDHPEETKMIRSEDKMKAILPYMVKRAARIKDKELRSKRS